MLSASAASYSPPPIAFSLPLSSLMEGNARELIQQLQQQQQQQYREQASHLRLLRQHELLQQQQIHLQQEEQRMALQALSAATSAASQTPSEQLASGTSARSQHWQRHQQRIVQERQLTADLHELAFHLHRVRYLQLLLAANTGSSATVSTTGAAPASSPIDYARANFAAFTGGQYDAAIQQLSALVFFPPAPAALTALLAAHCSTVEQQFTALWHRACHRGAPRTSPALLSLLATDRALPQLLRYNAVMRKAQQNADILLAAAGGSGSNSSSNEATAPGINSSSNGAAASNGDDERRSLLELDVGPAFQYHSTFVCPVTREQGSASNPPVMLKCGHLISTSAMERIVRQLRMTRKFKCPTCPREQTPAEVVTVHI